MDTVLVSLQKQPSGNILQKKLLLKISFISQENDCNWLWH